VKSPKPTFLERLTGATIEIEMQDSTGQTVKRRVSKKWFDRMVGQGKIWQSSNSESKGNSNLTDTKLYDQAKHLVSFSRCIAVSSYTPFLTTGIISCDISVDDWDFFVTVGAVCLAMIKLAKTVDRNSFEVLAGVITPQLRDWNVLGERALLDCQEFLVRTASTNQPNYGESFTDHDIVGTWVLWNLLNNQPSYEEGRVGGIIGQLLSEDLRDWWGNDT
jgi:hypothetical protein